MKPAEFYKIMEKFVEEDKRWRSLKVGDLIFDEQPRWFENDYHEMRIEEIDLDEREIKAHDTSNPNYVRTLGLFLTQEEFNNL